MSVIVKGMEMPKNCLTCKLRGDGSDSKYIWDCPFTGLEYTREDGETRRLDDCPLVEVPTPHGRLIDEENVKNAIYDRLKVLQTHEVFIRKHGDIDLLRVMPYIAKIPTIIEAEEGDEHDT